MASGDWTYGHEHGELVYVSGKFTQTCIVPSYSGKQWVVRLFAEQVRYRVTYLRKAGDGKAWGERSIHRARRFKTREHAVAYLRRHAVAHTTEDQWAHLVRRSNLLAAPLEHLAHRGTRRWSEPALLYIEHHHAARVSRNRRPQTLPPPDLQEVLGWVTVEEQLTSEEGQHLLEVQACHLRGDSLVHPQDVIDDYTHATDGPYSLDLELPLASRCWQVWGVPSRSYLHTQLTAFLVEHLKLGNRELQAVVARELPELVARNEWYQQEEPNALYQRLNQPVLLTP